MDLMKRVGTGRYSVPIVLDPTRHDLVAEFNADPHALHSDDLALLVGLLRTSEKLPRLVLLTAGPGGPWALAEVPAKRGEAPRSLPGATFETLADAERYVFALRWAALGSDAVSAP